MNTVQPLQDQIERGYQVIQKEIRHKLGKHFSRKPTVAEIVTADKSINKFVGMKEEEKGHYSMNQIERKLQFVSDSKVSTWLVA